MSKIARVKLPDGRVARFSVPDDASPEQVIAEANRHFAPKQTPKAAGKAPGGVLGFIQNNVLSPVNEALIGAAEGIYNVGSAISDPAVKFVYSKIYGDEAAEAALQKAKRQRRNIVDKASGALVSRQAPVARTIGRIGGAMLVPGPKVGGTGALSSAGNRAIQGAIGGAGVREVDEDAAMPALTGAAANVLLPPLISKLAQTAPAKAIGGALSRVSAPVVNALDNLAESALPSVNNFLGRPNVPLKSLPPLPKTAPVLATLGRKAQARAARLKSLGVERPTTGMVTRDPAAFSFEQNTAKIQGVGDDLARQMHETEASLVQKGRSMVRDLGGAKGPEATGKAVEDVLDAKRAEMQQVTSRLYGKVREDRGEELVGHLDGLRTRMADPDVMDNAIFDQMREGLTRRMTRLGLIGEGGARSKPINISQAEELRKFIGGLGSVSEPGVRMMRGRLIEALDDDVVNSVGDDAFKAARASAKERFGEFSKTFAGKLADEKLAPELLTKRVLGDSVKLSDLRALKQSMATGTEDQIIRGQTAWRDLQAQSIDDLLNKSVDADGNLIGSMLSREFNKSATKFRELLGPDDFKTLRRLSAATRDVKSFPVGHSVNTSNTAPTLANMFSGAPTKVRDGWVKLLGRIGARAGAHVGAAAMAGPLGNVAVEGVRAAGSAAVAQKAEQAAAQALVEKIKLAQSPEAAAAAIQEAQAAAASNPAVADFLNRAGFGRMLGGAAAAASQ